MILPISLTVAGAAALINLWLAIRVGQVRTSQKVSIGDGGNDAVIRRMRAHSNFVEYTPFILILIALIEMAVGHPNWLWAVAVLFIIGRIAHAIGMEGDNKGRMVGTIITMASLLGLGIAAIVFAHTAKPEGMVIEEPASASAESVPAS